MNVQFLFESLKLKNQFVLCFKKKRPEFFPALEKYNLSIRKFFNSVLESLRE